MNHSNNAKENKVAVVTGGGQGIGRGIALALAGAGIDVIVADIKRESAEAVVGEIDALGGRAIAQPLDVTDEASVQSGIASVLKRFSRVDILINNAGVMQRDLDSPLEDFDLCHAVNVKGLWRVTRALIPHFQQHRQGNIVNIASVSGRRGSAVGAAYGASKAAVINLTQSLAAALGPHNINVNAICPGLVWTPLWEKLEASMEGASFDSLVQKTPLQRAVTPEDIGHAVVFLTSVNAKNITGQALNVDAGAVMN